jgi:hypothetical protein
MKAPADDTQSSRVLGITTRHLWAGLPFFVLIWKGFLSPLPMLDFWWHLKAGEIIVNTGTIPRTDIFSFTAAGKPYILGNWLAEVIYYRIYRIGGFELLIFLNVLLLVAALVPVYRLCCEAAPSFRVCIFSATMAALCFYVGVRSQVFAFLLFSVFYWILSGFCTRRRDFLWLLPVLMILWVNLHGAFVLGLALIGIFLCSEFANAHLGLGAQKLTARELLKLVVILLLTCAATLVTPEGIGIYDYIRAVAADPSVQTTSDWLPPRIETLQGIVLFYGPFFLLVTALIYSRRRPGLTDIVLFLASSAFALRSMRNIIWFVILCMPLLARYFPAFPGKGSAEPEHEMPAAARRAPLGALNLLLASVAVFVLVLLSPWVRPRMYGTSLVAPQTPVQAMDFIEKHALKGRIFHPQEYGDYLIWRLWPEHRSFIDGRVHLFGAALVREYQQLFCDSGWERLLEPYDIRYLLLNKDREQAENVPLIGNVRKSPGWSVIYEDGLAVLFAKGPQAGPAQSLKYEPAQHTD